MKKLCLSLVALLMAATATKAEDGFSVNALTIPQGGTAKLEIVFESETAIYNRFQLEVQMPEGVTYFPDTEGDVICSKGALIASTDHGISASHIASQGLERFICYSSNNRKIPAGKGVIMTVTYQADASLDVGTVLTGHVLNVLWNDAGNAEYTTADIPFTITIGEPADTRVVLDETSTTAPSAATGVDVRVKRTINANEWSTIVLPFDMSAAQVTTAFGEDVQLADFTGYEMEEESEDVVGININFNALTAIEANHPCLIRVSSPVSEFTVDGVDIDPEEEPVVATVKRTRKAWSELIGTYVAQTEVPEKTLFLSGNQFWYSVGNTKMKAFRAYFDFFDVLTEVDENYANVRFVFNVDEATGVKGIGEGIADRTTGVYTLQGVKVKDTKALPKGVYIFNKKKIAIQ